MLARQIERFIRQPDTGDFDDLARAAFSHRFETDEAFRGLCESAGLTPALWTGWRQVPASTEIGSEPQRPATDPDLERVALEQTLSDAGLSHLGCSPTLSLVPGRELHAPQPSETSFASAAAALGGDGGVTAVRGERADLNIARRWLAARQRDRKAALLVATTATLTSLVEALERVDLRFRLPAGSGALELSQTASDFEQIVSLRQRVVERLDLSPTSVVGTYAPAAASSLLLTRAADDAGDAIVTTPHWTRGRLLAVSAPAGAGGGEAPAGDAGLICLFDLAGLDRALHVITGDIGTAVGAGFRLLRRATDAELRYARRPAV